MGEVYEVEDRHLQGIHVALKTILPHIADEPTLQQRFQREVITAREVTHPNLCPIYDIFRCEQPPDSFLFLTMKLLSGETLAARMQRPMPISGEEALAILKQLASGLAAIHAAGIVHRDIKPTNIMLDGIGKDVRLYITDFGLARAYANEVTLSGQGMVAGTPHYIAPELLLGQPPSQASDLFAFGVVMHEVFTSKRPTVAPDGLSVGVSPDLCTSRVPPFCARLVTECLNLDPARRCKAFEIALDQIGQGGARGGSTYHASGLWTRRRFAGAATAAAVVTIAGGAWWKWEAVDNLLHPLPRKRFVALLNWPKTADIQLTPMLTGVVNAIQRELIRAEAFDHDFFVTTPDDLNVDAARATHLKEICDPLGANLVLAASALPGPKHLQLNLRLLDPSSNRTIRERELTCDRADITTLPGKAVHAAGLLLQVSRYLKKSQRLEPGTQSLAAFTAFQEAEALSMQTNESGIEAAILKYKQAVVLDPNYAIAYAELANAYGRLYEIRRDPAALDLARANCKTALALNPDLVEAHLALAMVLQETGNEQGALDQFTKALALDPGNPNGLSWLAGLYTRLNRWTDAERTYNRLLEERPNHWVAYDNLGLALHFQGKYQAAVKAYRTASLAAPGSAEVFSNLGAESLQIGKFVDAREYLKKSLALDPNFQDAIANTSRALRYQGKYEEALPFALKAVSLNPAFDINWLELADCYFSLHGRQKEAKNAYLKASEEAERHLQIDAANGPNWMLLALYRVKSGSPQDAPALIEKAESLGANDIDSQLYKARILENLGRRDEALATLSACFQRGASDLQVQPIPDLKSLRADPRYRELVQTKFAKSKAN